MRTAVCAALAALSTATLGSLEAATFSALEAAALSALEAPALATTECAAVSAPEAAPAAAAEVAAEAAVTAPAAASPTATAPAPGRGLEAVVGYRGRLRNVHAVVRPAAVGWRRGVGRTERRLDCGDRREAAEALVRPVERALRPLSANGDAQFSRLT
jgi:hypothetical protein